MQPKGTLRLLLRAVDRHLTSVAGNKQWRQHVLQQFRQNAGLQDSQRQQQLLLLAEEYACLINNIAHHRDLLAKYNLGVDSEERNKRMVEATAARVGFQLPQKPGQAPPPRSQQQQQQQQGLQQQGLQQQREQQQREQQTAEAAGHLHEAAELDAFVEQQLVEPLRGSQQQQQQQQQQELVEERRVGIAAVAL